MANQPLELVTLADEFEREASEIQNVFDECDLHSSISGFNSLYGAGEDGCVVSLWDAWNRFMRALILSSVRGDSVGVAGQHYVPPTIYQEVDAIRHLQSNRRGTNIRVVRGEPNWYDPLAISDFCSKLMLPNSSIVLAAVQSSSITDGTGTSIANPISKVRIMRNYIAHKNNSTHADVTGLGVMASGPRAYLTEVVAGGTSRFTEWRSGMVAVADSAVG
jgi:hypothetical protein